MPTAETIRIAGMQCIAMEYLKRAVFSRRNSSHASLMARCNVFHAGAMVPERNAALVLSLANQGYLEHPVFAGMLERTIAK